MAEVCPSCRNPVATPDRFCAHCGQALTGPSAPAASSTLTPNPAPKAPRSGRRQITGSLIAVALLSASAGVLVGLHDGSPTALPVPSASTLPRQSPLPSTPIPVSTSPSTHAPPSASELSELRQLNQAIQLSERARNSVDTAVTGAGDCRMRPADAITMMNQAIATRQTAISQAEGTTTRDIPDGPAMLTDLLQALRDSTTADQDFIGWINDIANSGSCPISTAADHSYQAGYQESRTALTAKQDFVTLWNPAASSFGLPTYTANSI